MIFVLELDYASKHILEIPTWTPSWQGTEEFFADCEDGLILEHPYIIDATRISDGVFVSLKKIETTLHPHEVEIGRFFSSREFANDPGNQCVPIHDVLHDPSDENVLILVMPLLRDCDDPPFETIGEVVEFIRQLVHGLQYMHAHRVAHRDIMLPNVMLDPTSMYPDMYHPRRRTRKRDFTGTAKHYSRTERPTKYYYVDFGLSRKYNSDDISPRELPVLDGDKTVPEFQGEGYDKAADPFLTDIYYLGNLIRQAFLRRYVGFRFLDSLVTKMVQDEPQKRPTIDEVVDSFDDIVRKLSWWTLRVAL